MKNEFLLAAVIAMTLPIHANAATTNYVANLTELSGFGVNGVAQLSYNDVAMTLNVKIKATGLKPNQIYRVG